MHCDKVATLTLPQRLRTIGPSAFSQCEALPSVELPASLDSLAPGAFGDCKALTTVTIPEASNRFRSVGGILFDKSASTLLLYPAGRADSTYTVPEGIEEIGSQAFYTNRHITNVSAAVTAPYLPRSLPLLLPAGVNGSAQWSDCHRRRRLPGMHEPVLRPPA